MKSDVKKHERVHSGDTPYVCIDCGRGFNHSSNYNRHVRKRLGKCGKEAMMKKDSESGNEQDDKME